MSRPRQDDRHSAGSLPPDEPDTNRTRPSFLLPSSRFPPERKTTVAEPRSGVLRIGRPPCCIGSSANPAYQKQPDSCQLEYARASSTTSKSHLTLKSKYRIYSSCTSLLNIHFHCLRPNWRMPTIQIVLRIPDQAPNPTIRDIRSFASGLTIHQHSSQDMAVCIGHFIKHSSGLLPPIFRALLQ